MSVLLILKIRIFFSIQTEKIYQLQLQFIEQQK